MPKISLNIGGMDCASCAQNISRGLKKQVGVISADVNYANGKAYIEYDEAKIGLDKIKDAIKKTGYKVLDDMAMSRGGKMKHGGAHEHASAVSVWMTSKVILALIFTAPLLVRMVWEWEIPGSYLNFANTDWAQIILAGVVVFIFGWQFHRSAGKQIIRGQFNMDSLISLGTLTAFFYSLWAVFAGK
ncbi:MAG TPA: cation transporter, partial [Candidatus Methylomirabilis sp.]|nr:cation transporter [Candidatus Methylomirabilis sp.]